ncbi:MAG: tetratricopeptide repeat protein [Lentisphaerae bacterium]|nr:tetratricopeptide repeat protein [Lentisphaerota bacterium]MCP4102801.1 tetratricopeptide repeat protein [Lentisphaerota bacterium]
MVRFLAVGLLLFVVSVSLTAAEPSISVSPEKPMVGETVSLNISAKSRSFPSLLKKPSVPGLRWLSGSGKSSSIINGAATSETTYYFMPERKGTIKIPQLSVLVGTKVHKTKPIFIRAASGGEREINDASSNQKSPLKDLVFIKMQLLTEGKTFFVGEEIPVEIKLYYLAGLNVGLRSWPIFNLDKIIFRDYGKLNQENSRFAPPTKDLISIKGRRFIVIRFKTAFRPIATGKLDPSVNIPVEVRIPQRRNYNRAPSLLDDDFMKGFGRNYRTVPFEAKGKLPELTVVPLPPAPQGTKYLGLVGNWDIDIDLQEDKFKVGEPFTLSMKIKGIGTLDTLAAPNLTFPGTRVYPAEIDKASLSATGNQQAEVKYVMIPTRGGKTDISLNVCVFSAPLDKYVTFNFAKKIDVAKSDNPADNASTAKIVDQQLNADEAVQQPEKVEKPRHKSNILYLKKSLSGAVKVPLYKNYLIWYILLGLLGPLVWALSEVICSRRQRLGSDEGLRRKKSALARKSKLLKTVRKAEPDELDTIIQGQVVAYINDMMNLPPGTSASELADKVTNKELAEALKASGEASFMPGSTAMDKKELKAKMIKCIKTLGIFLLMFLTVPALQAAEKTVNKQAEKKLPATLDEAAEVYYNGDFSAAAKFFRSRIDSTKPDPALLYNLGNCLSQEGDDAGALVCFERARLLNPDDDAIIDKLNYVRRKFYQPLADTARNPQELVISTRNSLRPDQWFLIAMFAWAGAGIVLAFRRKLTANKMVILLGLCGIVFTACISALITEQLGPYSESNAVITSSNAELYSLPSKSSGRQLAHLRPGSKVNIVEERFDWLRIISNGSDGWILKDNLTRIAPGNPLPPAAE